MIFDLKKINEETSGRIVVFVLSNSPQRNLIHSELSVQRSPFNVAIQPATRDNTPFTGRVVRGRDPGIPSYPLILLRAARWLDFNNSNAVNSQALNTRLPNTQGQKKGGRGEVWNKKRVIIASRGETEGVKRIPKAYIALPLLHCFFSEMSSGTRS